MARPFYLYWSNIEDYARCPRAFLWGHGYGTIDLGRGPGRSKAKPPQESEHHALMGIVLARAIEHLYNDELWRDPKNLQQKLTDLVTREFTLSLPEKTIDWSKAPSRQEMLDVCLQGTLGYLRTMKANRLLGPYARSEVELLGWVDKYTPVAGRPDVIVRRDDTGVTIVDGKNSLTPGKYTNPDQLRWYALCFYLAYHTMPSRLGFVYFRYPEGSPPKDHPPEQPWTGMVDVPFNREDLKAIGERAVATTKSMYKEMFDPTPSSSACRFCDYRTVCDVAHQPTPRGSKSLPVLPDPVEGSNGIVEFGFAAAPIKKSGVKDGKP